MMRVASALLLFSLGLCLTAQEPKGPPEKKGEKGPKGEKGGKGDKGEKVFVALDTGGHTSVITSMAFTRDGKKLVTCEQKKVHVWTMPDGDLERTWHLPSTLHMIAISPDGSTVAAMGNVEDHPVWLLDLKTGASKTFDVTGVRGHFGIRSLTFSANGERLAWSTWYQAGAIDIEKKHVIKTIEREDRVSGAVFDKTGERLLVNGGNKGGNQFLVFDAKPGKKVAAKDDPLFPLKGSSGSSGQVSWSRDNTYFAGWFKEEEGASKLIVWNAEGKKDGDAIAMPGDPYVHHVQFIGDEKLVVVGTGNDKALAFRINAKTHKVEKSGNFTYKNPQDVDTVVAVSPNGKYVALTSSPGFRVQLYDLENGNLLRDVGKAFPIPEGVAWGPDNRSISWTLGTDEKGKPIQRGLNLSKLEALFEKDDEKPNKKTDKKPDEKVFAGFRGVDYPKGYKLDFDYDKRVLSVVRGGKRIETKFGQPVSHYTSYTDANGKLKLVVLGKWSGPRLSVIDPATGEMDDIDQYSDGTAISVSPDGRFLLLARHDQTLELYKLEDVGKKKHVWPFLHVLVAGPDWVVWTPGGFYASTFNGERMMGFASRTDMKHPLTFYPVERFRKQLYNPDFIKQVLDQASGVVVVKGPKPVPKPAPVEIARVLPPKATLELLKETLDKEQLKVKVKVSATSVNGEPVKALRLQIDGRSLPLNEKGEEQGYFEPKSGQKPEATWEVTVPPGVHQISVLVRGSESADRSNTVPVKAPIPESLKPTMFCLSVGINYKWDDKFKEDPGWLKGAENDAKTMLGALKENCAGKGDTFRYRAVESGDPLTGEAATKDAILDRLKEIRQKGAKPGDLVVLFYAGHGVAEGRDFYLLTAGLDPKDIPKHCLSGSELRTALKAMPCQVLLIFDACQSGRALDKFAPLTDELGRSLADDEAAVTVLAASMAHENAGEKDGNGRLTVALRDALSLKPGTIYDHDAKIMNIRHLHLRAEDVVRSASNGKQNPVLLAPWSMPPLVIRKVP